jgi:hypothetical protein
MNIFEIITGFFIAFILKDFYDIFFRPFIIKGLSKYRISIEKKEVIIYGEKNTTKGDYEGSEKLENYRKPKLF